MRGGNSHAFSEVYDMTSNTPLTARLLAGTAIAFALGAASALAQEAMDTSRNQAVQE